LTEQVRRSRANAAQQFPIAVVGKSAINRKLGVHRHIILRCRKDMTELVGQIRRALQQLQMRKAAFAVETDACSVDAGEHRQGRQCRRAVHRDGLQRDAFDILGQIGARA
jgi:hypothetical protein